MGNMTTLTMTNRIRANEQQVAAKVMDGEAILINLGTGVYYSLRASGGFIWSLIERQPSIAQIARCVAEHFEVDEAAAAADVLGLCDKLCAEGLALCSPLAAPAAALPSATVGRQPYEVPTLEKYTDMAEMFALDPPLPGMSLAQRD